MKFHIDMIYIIQLVWIPSHLIVFFSSIRFELKTQTYDRLTQSYIIVFYIENRKDLLANITRSTFFY